MDAVLLEPYPSVKERLPVVEDERDTEYQRAVQPVVMFETH
jgi:hypothetical protein